jgi:hypothetical protein
MDEITYRNPKHKKHKRECLGYLCRDLPRKERMFISSWVGERLCPQCNKRNIGLTLTRRGLEMPNDLAG